MGKSIHRFRKPAAKPPPPAIKTIEEALALYDGEMASRLASFDYAVHGARLSDLLATAGWAILTITPPGRKTRGGSTMAAVTYYVAVPFSRDEEGNLLPGEAKEAPNRERARGLAQAMADTHAGAIAFSRSGDPEMGNFQDAEIVAVFGAVDVNALAG